MKALSVAALVCLLGCSSLVPSTVSQLASLSPLDADPGAIEVALVLPEGLKVPPGAALLSISARRIDTGESETLDAKLLRKPSAGEGFPIPEGGRAEVYRMSDTDAARMRALQSRVAVWISTAPTGTTKGALSLGLGGCAAAGIADDARASAYIRVAKEGPFLPVIADAPLRQILGDALFEAIGPCNGPA